MKVRNGFVSNSSSTSFIVKIEDNVPIRCDKCGQYNSESIFYKIEQNKTGPRDEGLKKIITMKDIISEIEDLDKEEYGYLKDLIKGDNIYMFTLDNHGKLWNILDDSRVEIVFDPEE